LVVAKEAGFFREEGVALSILIPTVPEESLALVARGKADFGVGEQINLIQARAQGQPVISIAPLLLHTVVCLMYLKGGRIARLEDLRGRRVGWPGLAIDLPILSTMLDAAGLSLDDVQPVDVGFALTEALVSGKADAVFGAFVNYEQIEAEQRGAAVEFVSPTRYQVPDLYQLVLFTSDRVARRQPGLARGFLRAYQRGLTMAHEQPNEALGLYLNAHAMADPALSARTFDATLPYLPERLMQDESRWQAAHDWLLRRGAIGKAVPAEKLFTNRFVPKS
jgi:putative hydroxymethylpyrimidine transport system substrate-binding protein